jgi:hypothetical protein
MEEGGDVKDGKPCKSCMENSTLVDEYQGLRVLQMVRNFSLVYTYVWPWILIGSVWVQVTQFEKSIVLLIIEQIVCWGMWYFHVFWLMPYVGISRAFWKPYEKIESKREKMFLMKVGGDPSPVGNLCDMDLPIPPRGGSGVV